MRLQVTRTPREVKNILTSNEMPEMLRKELHRGVGITFMTHEGVIGARVGTLQILFDQSFPDSDSGRTGIRLEFREGKLAIAEYENNHHREKADIPAIARGVLKRNSPSSAEIQLLLMLAVLRVARKNRGMLPPLFRGAKGKLCVTGILDLRTLDQDSGLCAAITENYKLLKSPSVLKFIKAFVRAQGGMDVTKGQGGRLDLNDPKDRRLYEAIVYFGEPFERLRKAGLYYDARPDQQIAAYREMERRFVKLCKGKVPPHVNIDMSYEERKLLVDDVRISYRIRIGDQYRLATDRTPQVFFFQENKDDDTRYTLVRNKMCKNPNVDLAQFASILRELEIEKRNKLNLPSLTGRNWGGDRDAIGQPKDGTVLSHDEVAHALKEYLDIGAENAASSYLMPAAQGIITRAA